MVKRILTLLFLLITFILASILRLHDLGKTPAGFHADEAAFGYNTYSLLLTGEDEYGKSWPLFLKSFGEYKPATYAYLTIPFIKTFGLNESATRAPSALFGSFFVLITFFLVKMLFKNTRLSLISSLLIAINPWHINISRTVSEVNIALFFLGIGLLLLLKAIHQDKKIFLAGSFLFFILADLSYTAFNLLIPIIVLGTTYLSKAIFKKPMLVFVIFIVTFPIVLYWQTGFARLKQINIFTHPETQLVMEEQIREDTAAPQPLLLTRTFHNKLMNYGLDVAKNYFSYFNADFLFINGGLPIRMVIPRIGLFYLFELPFFLFGLYAIAKERKISHEIVFFWLLIAPIPASITFDEIPNIYRTLFFILPFEIIVAFGINVAIRYLKQYKTITQSLILSVCCLVVVFNFSYFIHQYFIHQKLHRPWYRGNGYKELVETVNSIKDRYKEILITKGHESPYIYFLFFGKYDPKKYQDAGSPRDIVSLGGFDKYRFVETDCPVRANNKGILETFIESEKLYIDTGECLLPKNGINKIKEIKREDGTTAFQLIDLITTNVR